jgi:hypothetical protein
MLLMFEAGFDVREIGGKGGLRLGLGLGLGRVG